MGNRKVFLRFAIETKKKFRSIFLIAESCDILFGIHRVAVWFFIFIQ